MINALIKDLEINLLATTSSICLPSTDWKKEGKGTC